MSIAYFTKLSGTSFHQDELAEVKPDKTKLRVVARPDNAYDPFAVEVQALLSMGWTQIGWIQKGKNQGISEHLQHGGTVEIDCKEITGLDKDTLGCNVSILYATDNRLDPIEMKDFEEQEVLFGDSKYVMFDVANHKAYDDEGNELISGSQAEHMFAPEVDLSYAANALSKSTGTKKEDILAMWDHNRDLSADLGTVIHAALEFYFKYHDVMEKIDKNKERAHSATNFMPVYLGEIVDKFIEKSKYREAIVEARIKYKNFTGIVDCLTKNNDGTYTLNDYKVVKALKKVKYKQFGTKVKYHVQQNFYREILEANGIKIAHMYLWQWTGDEWTRHELDKINVLENM